jgi:hypothetical protein
VAAPGARTSDFNGDGYNDLAVGAPGGSVGGKAQAGYVAVIPGSKAGLVPGGRSILHQDGEGVPGDPVDYARFGATLAVGDFNGDTFSDLAVGAPGDGAEQPNPTGSVTVFFGSPTGLSNPFRVTGLYRLGTALAAADMDGDGRPEILATETPSNFGAIYRFTVAKGAFVVVKAEGSAVYGLSALAGGDVNGDGYEDLVSLFRQVGGTESFAYFAGSPTGLAAEPASIRTFDGGVDLAIGDLNRDGRADLVVGQPLAPPFSYSGEVTVWYGTKAGFGELPSLTINQDSRGIPDESEDYDWFGSSVAVGDITGDGNPEIVIGAQQESVGATDHVGAVTVVRGSRTGPSTRKAQWFTPGVDGLPGVPELNRKLGWLATVRDFNGDRRAELAVTAIGGNASPDYPYYGDGSVTVLRGTTAGATAKGAQLLSSASLGDMSAGTRFGWSLGR